MTGPETLDKIALEDVIERTHEEMTDAEFEQALSHAEVEGARAGRKELRHWLTMLFLGVVLIAAVAADARLLFIAPALLALNMVPFILAGYTTTSRETEKQDLIDAIHRHEEAHPHKA